MLILKVPHPFFTAKVQHTVLCGINQQPLTNATVHFFFFFFTIGNGLHSNSSSILPITLLIKLDYRSSTVLLGGMQRVQAALVSAELLHGTSTKCVTGCDQHSETILYQPEGDLDQGKGKFTFTRTR